MLEREELESTRGKIVSLEKGREEIDQQLTQAMERYNEELCSFLSIKPESRLARWAEEILEYADTQGLDPRMFGSRLVRTIEDTKKIVSGDSSGLCLPTEGAAEWCFLQAVIAMRKQNFQSIPSEEAHLHLKEIFGVLKAEKVQDQTMPEKCRQAVYEWIRDELYQSASFWWVVVGEPS